MSSPPGPHRQSAAPTSLPQERRSLPPQHTSVAADSTRDIVQEDFLFHLYRGSELLQENRVLEAKEELEFALTMQPLDPKGQDLLGAVYFRVGLYPRAIQIYDGLAAQFPLDVSIKVNLALCFLKTGQPEPARRAMQEAVRINPGHRRAWGYLGLALQKLGELEEAQIAFERGGHAMMAKRLTERRRRPSRPASESSTGIDESVRSMAETAFSELDAGDLRFALAEPQSSRPGGDGWHMLELGDAAKARSPYATPLPPAFSRDQAAAPRAITPRPRAPTPVPVPAARLAVAAAPLLVPPPDRTMALHAPGVLLVRVDDGQAFAGRLDALRVIAGATSTRVLHRRAGDAETHEVLGGIGSPLVRVAGAAQLVLASRPARELALWALRDELAFVREDMLLGFELRLTYENARFGLDPEGGAARPPTDGAPVVQLEGSGEFVLELTGSLAAMPCVPVRPLLVRREWIVGWLGRLVPRALPAAEAPNGQRGLIGFSGEGTVLLCVT
jgi:hypothetical protein